MDPQQHDRFRKRFVAYLTGLLDDEEENLFRAHIDDCPDCRESWDTLASRSESREKIAGHIPASLLWRWPTIVSSIRGLEQSLIRNHLEECAECRQDLELLGHQPLLESIPELESPPSGARGSARLREGPGVATEPQGAQVRIVQRVRNRQAHPIPKRPGGSHRSCCTPDPLRRL